MPTEILPHDAARALRTSAIATRLDQLHLARFRGADARRALERLCAGAIRARDGQVQHVLLLDTDAHPFADAFLLCDDDVYDLLYEGPTPEAMRAHVAQHVPHAWDVAFEDRTATHGVIGVDGPFAWEVVSRIAGAESVGLPYLTFFHVGDFRCIRAGKTGEYGYLFVAPRHRLDALEASIHAAGQSLDLVPGSLRALDDAALESGFFNIRGEGRAAVTPIELQLQWRVNADGDGVGVDALRVHRANGVTARVTTLAAPGQVIIGDEVWLDAQLVGTVLNAAWSVVRDEWILLALLDLGCAVPGIDRFRVKTASGEIGARSVSPPVLNNASMFISPQMHSFATRREIALPPLVRR
jgi:glycine cleavage system aminomethyltransferase T